MADQSSILVIGASRGLGLALAETYLGRGAHVIATVRSASARLSALQQRFPASLAIESLDIADAASVRTLRRHLDGRTIETLFINAGICKARDNTTADVPESDFIDLMLTNALSPMRAIEILQDLVPAHGVIAVMSSELGSITNASGFWEIYSASKAALNMLMKSFAARHAGDARALLLIAPGWVRTEMGGPGASLSIEESIPLVTDAVEASHGRPGLRFIDRHGRALPW